MLVVVIHPLSMLHRQVDRINVPICLYTPSGQEESDLRETLLQSRTVDILFRDIRSFDRQLLVLHVFAVRGRSIGRGVDKRLAVYMCG